MNIQNKHIIKVLTVGLICLIIFTGVLFWARQFCQFFLMASLGGMYFRDDTDKISTMDLLGDYEYDPNLINHSSVWSSVRWRGWLGDIGLGISQEYFVEIMDFSADKNKNWGSYEAVFFDRQTGLFIHCSILGYYGRSAEEEKVSQIIAYAGPEGVSPQPVEALGRFSESVAGVMREGEDQRPVLLAFDRRQSCFIRIDFAAQTIRKGPKLPANGDHQPVQIGQISKHDSIYIGWLGPTFKALEPSGTAHPKKLNYEDDIASNFYQTRPHFLPVLDAAGEIHKLDTEKLEITDLLGRLFAPKSRYDIRQTTVPEDLLDYKIQPLFVKGQYRGLFTASLSRQGTRLGLAVFDVRGRFIIGNNTHLGQQIRRQPYGPLFQVLKYLLENLHPPLLSLVSVFTAEIFEVESDYRAVFILPNSYFAGYGAGEESISLRFLGILLVMAPALLLGFFLAVQVARDAAVVGLSRSVVWWWMAGTLAFGLVGYITYRLTRPQGKMVTCSNCGNLRRPDGEHCHRCGAGWDVAELTPPAWRVFDESATEA